ncbi:MAG TPA: glycosyltransferase family 2 protein [Bacteroidia bacterium]|nr:glycosyltransferase family 2 protein [Bacteroidia bacterium]
MERSPAPAVSVILPVFNAEKTVQRAIESVLTQTFHDFELLLADDGSMDSTNIILEETAAKDHRVRVITLAHTGVAGAFNAGVKAANGKYVARMDADDEMLPQRLEKQFDFLEARPATGVVSCLVEYGGDRATQEGYSAHVDWINSIITHEQIMLNRFVESPLCNPSVMFRKELFEKHGGCREGNFPEDYELWLRWLEAGVRMEKIRETLFRWNDLPGRLIRNDERYSADNFFRIKEEYLSRFISKMIGGRKLFIWGAGKLSGKRSSFLAERFSSCGYIDIDPKKAGGKKNGLPVIYHENIGAPGTIFVASFVTNRGKREEVKQFLEKRNFREGVDFILAG